MSCCRPVCLFTSQRLPTRQAVSVVEWLEFLDGRSGVRSILIEPVLGRCRLSCKDEVNLLSAILASAQVTCKPGSVKPHARFEGEIYALNKEEGGRHTPFFTNYKPQFFFRTADITGGP